MLSITNKAHMEEKKFSTPAKKVSFKEDKKDKYDFDMKM